MKKDKIGILDSGIGGVSVLLEIVKLLPDYQYVYFSDSKNNPYGDKSQDEIKKIVFDNVSFLKEKGCKIIVIACNTATAVAVDLVRKEFPELVIIGTEPAIKMVYDAKIPDGEGITLLLATKLTLESERVLGLQKSYPVSNLVPVACVGLADLIESGDIDSVDKYIKDNLLSYSNVKAIVLGCTHYPLVKSLFQKYFPNSVIFDGSKGVSKQVEKKVKEISLPESLYSLEFIDSNDTNLKKELFERYFSR